MYNSFVISSAQDTVVTTGESSENPADDSYSRREIFNAALQVAKRSAPFKGKADETNSRLSESSFILIGKEGEILSRVKLEIVYRQCRINRRKNHQKTTDISDEQGGFGSLKSVPLAGGIKKRFLIIGGSVVAVIAVISSCNNYYDQKSRDSSRERLEKIVKEWDADLNVASSTARIALSPPVMKLRDYAQSVDRTPVHDCFDEARSTLREYMDATVQYFTKFMADADADISGGVEKSTNLRKEYEKELDACK